MAICKHGVKSYEGKVVGLSEHNMTWDSYYYAVVFDGGKLQRIEYDSTAYYGDGSAEVDATPEVLSEMYRTFYNESRTWFDTTGNEKQAKEYDLGDMVTVVRGRKIPKGTTGKVFWMGEVMNHYKYRKELRVGLEKEDGERVFLPAEYVINAGWEKRLKTGKGRKKAIRSLTVEKIPYEQRKHFTR